MNFHFLFRCLPVLGMAGTVLAHDAGECSQVYFLREGAAFQYYASTVAEVMLRSPPSDSRKVHGLLLNGDWGVMKVCQSELAIGVRLIVDPTRKGKVDRRQLKQPELIVTLASRDEVYVSLMSDGTWLELSRDSGQKLRRKIEQEARGYERLLGREGFTTNRYGVICKDCIALTPADVAFEESPR